MSLREWIGGAAIVALVLVVVLFIAGVIDVGDGNTPSKRTSSDARFLLGPGDGPPREFLYLDAARTDAYVSQFQGGLATLEKTSATDTDTRAGGLEGGPAKLSRELQAQDMFERQVTPTNASRFFSLTRYLSREETEAGDKLWVLPRLPVEGARSVAAKAAAAKFKRKWARVREGDFVRLQGRVRLPDFMRLYQTIRQVPADSPIGKQGKTLINAIGLDPRFPFNVTVGQDDSELRLILPAQYSAVATESSLFYGDLTVLGKVIYRIDPGRDAYRDLQTYNRFRPILRQRRDLRSLLTRLGLDPNRLRAELLRYRTVEAPAAIILPVAIHK